MAETSTTQLAVIGGGPGGYAAAFLAADLGMEVTLIDLEANPGGVCLYRGCIPSKALLHVAKLLDETRHAAEWGIEFGEPRIKLAKLRAFKERVVDKLTGGVGQVAKLRKVRFVRGRAKLLDAHRVEIDLVEGGRETLEFQHAILATGSEPAKVPGFPEDPERILDSTGALELRDVPEKLLVVGGGYIGLELGSVYAALGSKVTVVEMMPSLLAGADPDLVRPLARKIEERVDSVLLETRVAGMKVQKNGVKVRFEGKNAVDGEKLFDKVLVSIGRRPNSAGLGLESTAVVVDDRGFVQVDQQLRTREPSIYAIGDLVGQPMLAHKASHEGRTAVEAIAGHKVAFEPAAIPAVVFTDPEVAWCGLTETEAKARDRKVSVARFPWAASGRAQTLDRSDGVTKLIFDPETERVLGVGICGPGAGELIAEGVLAVEMAATATDLKLSIHPHPTLSETVMESAEVFFGQSTHVFRPVKK
ncbi:dihydrolipoamide dehydrogenase [Acidobacteria bacterium Mor1]|nr:dihydrolipoamide dehydrogenase [Acidobacteria bacterium Mor1]